MPSAGCSTSVPQKRPCHWLVHAIASMPAAKTDMRRVIRRINASSRAVKSSTNPIHATGIVTTPMYFRRSTSNLRPKSAVASSIG